MYIKIQGGTATYPPEQLQMLNHWNAHILLKGMFYGPTTRASELAGSL